MELYATTEFWRLGQAFIQNVALFIVIAFVLGRISDRTRGRRGLRWHFAASLLFTLGALASMAIPYQPAPGILLDQRNVILLFAGPFGGPVAAVVAGVTTACARLYVGGAGAWAGFGAALSSMLLGLYFMRALGRLETLKSAMLGGLMLGFVNVPWVLLFPNPALGGELLANFAVPFLIFYLSAPPVLSAILMVHRRRLVQEAELARNRQTLSDVLDISTDWFWEVDADLRFTFLSQSFNQVFSRDPSYYIGKRRSDLAVPEMRQEVLDYEDMLRRERPFTGFRYRLLKADGAERFVSISGKPIYDDDGAFAGYRGSGREVTEAVQAENALRQALKDAEEANRAKSAFLSQMSHELRTPLNAVIGFAEMIGEQIRGPVGNPAYLEDARSIRDSGNHLLGLINQLLDLSKIEAGKLELRYSACRPAEIVDWVAEVVRKRVADRNLDWQVTDRVPDMTLWLDEQAVRQVVLNLAANAIKFTPDGGSVIIMLDRGPEGGLLLTVEDTGSGIAKEELEQVFSPFERAANAKRGAVEGTGLGLAISKALVEAHGGRIDLVSRLGEGTKVTVHLPADGNRDSAATMAA